MNLNEYVQTANDAVTVILQIEHVDALPHVADILTVPGVDAVIVGPYDLSASMGLPGQIAHPDVAAAVAAIADACNRAGTPWRLRPGRRQRQVPDRPRRHADRGRHRRHVPVARGPRRPGRIAAGRFVTAGRRAKKT